jgi:hypothetical protein
VSSECRSQLRQGRRADGFVNVEGTVIEAPDDFDRILPMIAERYSGETIYRIRPITVHAKLDGGNHGRGGSV